MPAESPPPTPTELGQTVFIRVSTAEAQTHEQRKLQGEQDHMARFVGTGTDPRYPKGVVVDIPDASDSLGEGNLSQLDLVEKGYVEASDPYQDPGRTPSQIANAVVRGDTLSDPYDAAVAVKEGFTDAQGVATARAYDVVHENPQDVDGRGESSAIRGTVSAFRANERDGLPKEEGADTADTDIAVISQDELPASDYEASGSAGEGDNPKSAEAASKADGDTSGSRSAQENPSPSKTAESASARK